MTQNNNNNNKPHNIPDTTIIKWELRPNTQLWGGRGKNIRLKENSHFSPTLMNNKFAEYFNNTPICQYSHLGLAIHLGISSRRLAGLRQNKELGEMIEMAMDRINMKYELGLDSFKPVGAIFALKAKGGWREDTKEELDTKPVINIINYAPTGIKEKKDIKIDVEYGEEGDNVTV